MGIKKPLIALDILEKVAPVIRNVAHPLRLRILDYLRYQDEAQTVSEIIEAAGGGQAVISQHLRVLRDQGVVSARRDGNYVLYELADENMILLLDCIRQHGGKGK